VLSITQMSPINVQEVRCGSVATSGNLEKRARTPFCLGTMCTNHAASFKITPRGRMVKLCSRILRVSILLLQFVLPLFFGALFECNSTPNTRGRGGRTLSNVSSRRCPPRTRTTAAMPAISTFISTFLPHHDRNIHSVPPAFPSAPPTTAHQNSALLASPHQNKPHDLTHPPT
jgi:hypothetical protein